MTSWFNPQPLDMPIKLPRQLPMKIVPSFIGEPGQVLNLLMHHGSGRVVRDYSPYRNHGEAVNPDWRDGPWGWCLHFDSERYVRVPDHPSLRVTGAITFGAWVFVEDTTRDTFDRIITKKPTWDASEGYSLTYRPSDGTLSLIGSGATHLDICLLYTSPSPRDRG